MKFGVQKNSASIANDMYKGGIFYLQKRIIGAYKNSPPSRLSPARQTRFYFPQNASELTQQLALQLRRSNSCRFLHAGKILDLILTHSPESDTRKFKEDRKNKNQPVRTKSEIVGLGHDAESARRGLKVGSPAKLMRGWTDQGRQGSLHPLSFHASDSNQ